MIRPKSALSTTALAISLVAVAPTASAVLIDFDGIASGTLVGAPISGVTFTLDNGELPSISSVSAGTSSPPNGLLNATAFSFAVPEGNLTMSFGGPVSNLSFFVTFENGDLGLTVFQGAASTALNFVFDGDPVDADLVDLSGFAGVTAVTLTHAFPDDYYLIDNVSFDPTAVPVPATGLLVGAGLMAMGWRRRAAIV